MKAPFPYFGGKSRSLLEIEVAETPVCLAAFDIGDPAKTNSIAFNISSSDHLRGWPVRFVSLFVDQFLSLLVSLNLSLLSENSNRCSCKCSALLSRARFDISSFSLFRSLWCKLKPFGIGPLTFSHSFLARSSQVLGSAILTKALFSPPLLYLVRMVTDPKGSLFNASCPVLNMPVLGSI